MQASEPISSETLRYYMSENTDHHQFSRMINLTKKKKNIIINLPQLLAPSPPPPPPHQLYSYGYGDIFFSEDNVQLMLPTDNKNILNVNQEISSIYMGSNLYNQQQDQFHDALAFSSQPYINHHYQSAASAVPSMKSSADEYYCCPSFQLNIKSSPTTTTTTTLPSDIYDDNIYKKQQELCREHYPVKEITSEMNNYCCSNTRKQIPEENKPPENDWKSNKKKKKKRVAAEVCCQEQSQDYQFFKDIKQVHRERTPVRRSQKLADRITALQKLVSPYGKTDTASVLYEASIFIKVLQDQIQNIFNTQPDNKPTQQKKNTTGEEEKELDLRNKGLCLVPFLLTQKLVEEDLGEEQLWMPSFNSVLHEN